MKIIIFLYKNMTVLDAIGPYEVLSRMPGTQVRFVAEETGPVLADTKALSLVAEASIDDIKEADILLIPGGPGDKAVRENAKVLDWVKAIHETTQLTLSVCSGSLILGAAGILDGEQATSHWAVLDDLKAYGATPQQGRYVESGKITTAAGVSAGIDMALHILAKIAGEDLAKGVQLGLEYDPQPPFDAGSPDKAPEHIVQMLRMMMEADQG